MTLAVLLQSHTVMLFGWTMGVFVFIAILDFAYQSHSHEKKLMMSIRDLKDEYKNNEGDPHIKGQRQQLAREWAQEGAVNSASDASVLVVNPTHVAIALIYDKDQTPVPVVAARGVGDTALAMRRAAVASGVPVLRNIPLARQLLRDTENGDIVPRELFDIIAEVILWASANKETADHPPTGDAQSRPQPPGEDLSKETI